MSEALQIIDAAIADLEARLNLKPGEVIVQHEPVNVSEPFVKKDAKSNEKKMKVPKESTPLVPAHNIPDICKLEFKVGVITKVWVHEKADKLYCEEIDVGEEQPRQIASGLRPHFSIEQMQGQRLLVVSNLKAKNLVGFKSHGMVLCAAETTINDEGVEAEHVEFVEPPADAKIGEIITFEGLPPPEPVTPNQCEKLKLFQLCMDGMKTTSDCIAAWNGHIFLTSAGPCVTRSIANGVMR